MRFMRGWTLRKETRICIDWEDNEGGKCDVKRKGKLLLRMST